MSARACRIPGGSFSGWAPGRGPIVAPEVCRGGLSAARALVVELHLLPSDRRSPCSRSSACTSRARRRCACRSRCDGVEADRYSRRCGGPRVTEPMCCRCAAELIGVFPHAHYLGREMLVTATLPGASRTLLHIKHWSFHWQQDYRYVTPLALRTGTTIVMRYSGPIIPRTTAANPNQPPRRVTWGPAVARRVWATWVCSFGRAPAADASILQRASAARGARDQRRRCGDSRASTRPDNAGRAQRGSAAATSKSVAFAEAIAQLQAAVQARSRVRRRRITFSAARCWLPVASTRRSPACERRYELAPDDAHLHFNVGKALAAAGRAGDAAMTFERAIRLESAVRGGAPRAWLAAVRAWPTRRRADALAACGRSRPRVGGGAQRPRRGARRSGARRRGSGAPSTRPRAESGLRSGAREPFTPAETPTSLEPCRLWTADWRRPSASVHCGLTDCQFIGDCADNRQYLDNPHSTMKGRTRHSTLDTPHLRFPVPALEREPHL